MQELQTPAAGALVRLNRRQVTVGVCGEDSSVVVTEGSCEGCPVPSLTHALAGKEMTQPVEGQMWEPQPLAGLCQRLAGGGHREDPV